MKKSLFAAVLMVLIGAFLASFGNSRRCVGEIRGAIGDIPVSNVAGTVTPTVPSLK
jgi:hypothetical protein